MNQELSCGGCGDAFVFTKGEQTYFRDKGQQPPKRCPSCREDRRAAPEPGSEPEPQEGHEAVCSACGTMTHLPFEPTSDRPVYCPSCFRNR